MDPGNQLIRAAKDGNGVRVEELLKNVVNPNSRDHDGFTPLYWACCKGHLNISRSLVCWDCDVNARGKADATPIMASADNGHIDCLKLLLSHRSIKVNSTSDRGDTALHMAAYRGFPEIVDLLCRAGADLDVYNDNQQTPLGEAFINDHTECVRILKRAAKEHRKPFNRTSSKINGNGHAQREGPKYHLYQVPPSPTPPSPRSYTEPPFFSSDSAMGSSLQSAHSSLGMTSHVNYSRIPDCVDERTDIATSTGARSHTDIMNINMGHPYPNCSGCVDSGTHYVANGDSTLHDSFPDSMRSDGSLCSNIININSNFQTCQPHSPESNLNIPIYNPLSIDSQYTSSSSSHSGSMDYASGTSAISYAPPIIKHTHHDYNNKNNNNNNNNNNIEHSMSSKTPSLTKRKLSSSNSTQITSSVYGGDNRETKSSMRASQNDSFNIHQEFPGHSSKDANTTYTKTSHTHHRPQEAKDKPVSGVREPEMLSGLKVSSFVENLQLKVLTLEQSLHQERESKNELRKENKLLYEENVKLKRMFRNMSQRY